MTISDESGNNSDSEGHESPTDVDEDHIEGEGVEMDHRAKGHYGNHKGPKKPSKDIGMMAQTATTHLRTVALVSLPP